MIKTLKKLAVFTAVGALMLTSSCIKPNEPYVDPMASVRPGMNYMGATLGLNHMSSVPLTIAMRLNILINETGFDPAEYKKSENQILMRRLFGLANITSEDKKTFMINYGTYTGGSLGESFYHYGYLKIETEGETLNGGNAAWKISIPVDKVFNSLKPNVYGDITISHSWNRCEIKSTQTMNVWQVLCENYTGYNQSINGNTGKANWNVALDVEFEEGQIFSFEELSDCKYTVSTSSGRLNGGTYYDENQLNYDIIEPLEYNTKCNWSLAMDGVEYVKFPDAILHGYAGSEVEYAYTKIGDCKRELEVTYNGITLKE